MKGSPKIYKQLFNIEVWIAFLFLPHYYLRVLKTSKSLCLRAFWIFVKLVLYLFRSKLSTKWYKVVFCGKILDIFTVNKVHAI